MGSKNNPERLIFNDDRSRYDNCASSQSAFIRDSRGWILFGPSDVRGTLRQYTFCLQKLPKQDKPRVRAGCRYYTLAEAWAHWGARRKGFIPTSRKNERKQAVALIRLLLLQAQAYGLISMYANPIKFDSSLARPKRK